MSGTFWGILALGGIAVVAGANLLRARRTGDRGCIGHFFVAANEMSSIEWVMNRAGIAVFVGGVIGSLVL